MAQKHSCSSTNKGRKFTMGSRFPQFCTSLHCSRASLQWRCLRQRTYTRPEWTCDHMRWQQEMTTGLSAMPLTFTGCPQHAVSSCKDASSFLCSKHSVIITLLFLKEPFIAALPHCHWPFLTVCYWSGHWGGERKGAGGSKGGADPTAQKESSVALPWH